MGVWIALIGGLDKYYGLMGLPGACMFCVCVIGTYGVALEDQGRDI